ncbi:MAG: hypothetical protein QOF37_1264, partial [Thermoleophilaceae bacterium]|nr:hypothetical protein [Thermoleophilaceae bacterium]
MGSWDSYERLRGRITPQVGGEGLTRRVLLERAARGAGALALSSQAWPAVAGAAKRRAAGLPSPAQVRADFQRMVDFGPRLTGNDAHNRFIAWLEKEFSAAGCELLPCDVYETSRWEVGSFGLDVLEGAGAGPAKVATYFPRSKETPAGGVSGPLVYGGTAPQVSMNGTDAGALQAGLARYPADVASWAQALPSTLGGDPRGSILVVDLPAPLPTTAALFSAATFYNGQGETAADLLTEDYKRLWLHPGLAMPLAPFAGLGVAGVVLILDASYEALTGQYLPFEWQNEDVPALYVDRDSGARLRAQAGTRPKARLTLSATRKTVPTPTVTAILPGASKETLIFNTHTDGQGFVEENGPVAFVQLARYFAGLPAAKRLKRTLVFAAWPGHMSNDLPQAQGWIDAHKDLVDRAAAALTVEHLGCTEWSDTTDRGYRPTGRPELFAIFTTQGKLDELTRDAVVAHDLPRTALMRAPIQFGVGGPFYSAGVPEIGAIAGPEYLLTISDNAEMDKLDEHLAARQIACLADLATRLDPVSAQELRAGDPLLGAPAPKGNIQPSSTQPKAERCGPAPAP